jgi:predicted O-methyltransferase YrrM
MGTAGTAEPSTFDYRSAQRTIQDLGDRLRDAEARVVERERANAEREATVLEREATIARLEESVVRLRSGTVGDASPFADLGQWLTPGKPIDKSVLVPLMTALMPKLEGWCTVRKACLLAGLVIDLDARVVGEIGVYGGRSLIPMALAMRGKPRAAAYGIEPWSNSVAVQTPTHEANDEWWSKLDFHAIKKGFVSAMLELDCLGTVKIVEMTSDQAYGAFSDVSSRPFDLLHIDGSHSTEQALADVRRWTPLVRSGGVVVLDDILWDSVRPARDFLAERATIIEEVAEIPGSIDPSYGAYRMA